MKMPRFKYALLLLFLAGFLKIFVLSCVLNVSKYQLLMSVIRVLNESEVLPNKTNKYVSLTNRCQDLDALGLFTCTSMCLFTCASMPVLCFAYSLVSPVYDLSMRT